MPGRVSSAIAFNQVLSRVVSCGARPMMMAMNDEHDIAAIVQWVAEHRGADAGRYTAEQIVRLTRRGDEDAARLWRRVGAHFPSPGHEGARPVA